MDRMIEGIQKEPAKRVVFFDTLRGFTLVSMVGFHTAYDLAYLYGMDMPWFTSGILQDIWRASISWTFLLLAGWMTQHSRNNLKRGLIYAGAALLIYIITSIASVDVPISFGILYCMAFCTIIYTACTPAFKHVNPAVSILACLAIFVLTYNIPHAQYSFTGLSWLGFPGPGFASGDYYPPIPYFFLYAAGGFASMLYRKRKAGCLSYPDWMKRDFCPPLTFLGRHSLLIYLIHQPIVLGVLAITMG